MPSSKEEKQYRMRKIHIAAILSVGLVAPSHADNWMNRLPDELYAAAVSIPGTHDSATGDGFSGFLGLLGGSSYAKTQDLTIAEQWAAGVRAFDFRPCVDGDELHINHGVIATSVTLQTALTTLRDSLAANPSEFAVVHLRHETEGDGSDSSYGTLLTALLGSDDFSGLFADFSRDLTVGELRGKILLTSRDTYATSPVGAFISGWCSNIDWASQTKGTLTGAGSGTEASSPLYMQDFYDTHADGAVEEKVEAVTKLLTYSATHAMRQSSAIRWYYNFTSGYSKTGSIFGTEVSTSDGYRDNASYTNAAVISYLQSNEAGPAGIVMMDYAGVNTSSGYNTLGQALIDTLIANNFNYLARVNAEQYATFCASITTLSERLASAKALIASDYSDVAADFDARAAAIASSLDSLQADLDERYGNTLLLETSRLNTTAISTAISALTEDAAAAQAEYDRTVPVSAVTITADANISGIYSLAGEQLSAPPVGSICILRYSDGAVRKVKVE